MIVCRDVPGGLVYSLQETGNSSSNTSGIGCRDEIYADDAS